MSTNPESIPQGGDPLAGMEEGQLTLNTALANAETTKSAQPLDEPSDEPDAPEDREVQEGEAGDEATDDGKPKKNKVPRDERIKQLTGEKKDLLRQIEEMKQGSLQSQIDEIKKLLTPPENSVNIPDNRDTAPDPDDLTKYRLGDLDPAYTRDLIRHEFRQEQIAEHQRQVQRETRAQQEQRASETLSKVTSIADKGTELYPDYVETVAAPFLQGRLPLEEATFEAAAETDHAHEILRELALNPAEAARVATLTPFKQVQYVAERARHFEEQAKPRLPRAGAPPQNTARGNTGGRFGIRGDEDDLDRIEKALYQRR